MDIIVEGYAPGDAFDVDPATGSKIISILLSHGTDFYIDGNTIVIESVGPHAPGVNYVAAAVKADPIVAPEVPAVPEEVPAIESIPAPEAVEAPALVSEEPTGVSPEVEALENEGGIVEVEEAPKPAAKRGRKPAAPKVEAEEVPAPAVSDEE